MVKFNVNQCKILLDNFLKYEKEIFMINKFAKKWVPLKNKSTDQSKQDTVQNNYKFSVLIYRILVQINYNELKLRIFSTFTFKSGEYEQKIDQT